MFEDNKIIAMTRSLGYALQQEKEFLEYMEARQRNDEDAELQNMIEDFNEVQSQVDVLLSKDEKDTEKIEELSNRMDQIYQAIMQNENMENYNEKRLQFDQLMQFVNRILLVSMNGGDPFGVKEEDCTGKCATCGGCG